jgi:MYXO-CTERM domain-containing protein
MTARASRAVLPLLLSGALAACTANVPDEEGVGDEDPDGSAAQVDQAIVNGQVDTDDPAVVALIAAGNFVCTGTLIRPTVVLTAAHCVPPNIDQFGATSYGQMSVFFGNNLGGSGQYRQVVDGWTHPAWNDQVLEDDIALLRLDSPGPATPIPFNTDPMSALDNGQQIRILGFGMTGSNQYDTIGPKREALTTIAEVYAWVFTLDPAPGITCNGDSGGTTLMVRGGQEVVAGIHSRSDCETQALDTRVDEYETEIYAFLGETPGEEPGCHADGQCATGCGAPDPDCPCVADGLCTEACPDPPSDPDCQAACGADGQCATGCSSPDPDCGTATCPADGICDPSCASDPDCGTAPGNDGWNAGDVEPKDYDAMEGGCAMGGEPDQGDRAPWLLLTGLALALGRRRRPRKD